MASQQQGTAARAPPPASLEGPACRATVQRCVVLDDWWLVRGEDDKIRVAGYADAERNRAARLFCSGYITMRHADGALETADHKILLIRGPLNITQMHCNGFPYEVSKNFIRGFPVQWERYANSNMNQMDENTQSPSKPTRYYIDKFLHGSFINSVEYNFMEVDSKSSKGPTSNTDGPPSQGLSDLPNGTPSIQEPSCNTGDYDNSVIKVTPSERLCNGRMGMPDESCEDHVPAETCSGNTNEFPVRGLSSLANGTPRIQEPSGNSGDYHNLMSNTTASEGLCNGRMDIPDESFEDPGTGETCSGQICQAEKPHELEALTKGLSPAFGLLQSSKDSTGRTLRSGKLCEMPIGSSVKKGHSKTKKVHHETLNMKVIPTEARVPPMPNGSSVKKGHSKTKRVHHETLSMKVIPTEETEPPMPNGSSVKKGHSKTKRVHHETLNMEVIPTEETEPPMPNGSSVKKGHSKTKRVHHETLNMEVIPTEATAPPMPNGSSVKKGHSKTKRVHHETLNMEVIPTEATAPPMPNGSSVKKGHSKMKRVHHETLNMKVIPTEETEPPIPNGSSVKKGHSKTKRVHHETLNMKVPTEVTSPPMPNGSSVKKGHSKTKRVHHETLNMKVIPTEEKEPPMPNGSSVKKGHSKTKRVHHETLNMKVIPTEATAPPMPNGSSVKKGHSKTKRVHHETLNMKVIPTEETEPPSDLTCQKNGGSVAQIPAEDKLQSQDSSRRGRGRPRKKARHGENI